MCFLAAVNGPRHWLLASNSDNPYTTRNHLLVADGDGHAYLAVRVLVPQADPSVPWAGMLTRGVNAAGLGFTYAFVPGRNMPDYPMQTWTARMLANAGDDDEAVSYEAANRALPGNYLLADRSGRIAVVEVGTGQMRVHVPTAAEARTNVWQCLSEGVEPSWETSTASTHRQGRGAELLDALPATTPEALWRVLRDHQEDAAPVGQHGRALGNHGTTDGTISSEIVSPSGHLWFGYGFPCGAARGHEQDARVSWGRLVRFSLVTGCGSGDVTTPDGTITPLGVRLISGGATT